MSDEVTPDPDPKAVVDDQGQLIVHPAEHPFYEPPGSVALEVTRDRPAAAGVDPNAARPFAESQPPEDEPAHVSSYPGNQPNPAKPVSAAGRPVLDPGAAANAMAPETVAPAQRTPAQQAGEEVRPGDETTVAPAQRTRASKRVAQVRQGHTSKSAKAASKKG